MDVWWHHGVCLEINGEDMIGVDDQPVDHAMNAPPAQIVQTGGNGDLGQCFGAEQMVQAWVGQNRARLIIEGARLLWRGAPFALRQDQPRFFGPERGINAGNVLQYRKDVLEQDWSGVEFVASEADK